MAFGKHYQRIRGVLQDSGPINKIERRTYLILIQQFGSEKAATPGVRGEAQMAVPP
jgi:hypothetical protein